MRCYDQQSFSDFISDFLSIAGLNSTLYEHWESILPLITGQEPWEKSRNLVLIALASYEPSKKRVENDEEDMDDVWDADTSTHKLIDNNFDPVLFIDDDVLGYMGIEAAKIDVNETGADHQKDSKKKKKEPGKSIPRLGALGVTRGISLTPYNGSMTFNAKSGEKDRTSLHFHEYYNTRYQYGFALDPNHLKDKSRIFAVIDGLMSIRKVGGHNNVFCYDFSPESMVFRWTQENGSTDPFILIQPF